MNVSAAPPRSAARIGIVTVSDRASRGEYEDRGGPAVRAYLDAVLVSPWVPVVRVVSDDLPRITAVFRELAEAGCDLVVTTGGTGPAVRDVTPEATAAVCDKLLPGFGEAMRWASWQQVPTAILSRQVAGVCGRTLVVNLPGQPKAIAECLDAVFPAIPHCIHLIGGARLEIDSARWGTGRPPGK